MAEADNDDGAGAGGDLEIRTVTGEGVLPYVRDLARLRIEVFREYPYCYDGDLAYEEKYLRTYAGCVHSFFVIAFDPVADRVVGVSTGMPLADEVEAFRAPFEAAGIDPAGVFYCGESVLEKSYRGRGIGAQFMAERLAHAAALPGQRWVAFCAVDRAGDDPRRPPDHRPLDAFWQRRGFRRCPGLRTELEWKEVGEEAESHKPLTFWLRPAAGRPELPRVRVAAAGHPVRAPGDWDDFAATLRGQVAAAAETGAELLCFPEYGALQLGPLLGRGKQRGHSGGGEDDLRALIEGMQAFVAPYRELHAQLARTFGLWVVAASLPVHAGPGPDRPYRNRAYVFGPKGEVGHQDKLRMTRFEEENWGVEAGDELALFEMQPSGLRFGVNLCYDAEFPAYARRLAEAGAHLVIVPSCTDTAAGAKRVRLGARARAMENQCYTLVSPTAGEAPWSPAIDVNTGYAACFGPPDRGFPHDGVLTRAEPGQPWLTADLDPAALDLVRRDGQVLNLRDWPETPPEVRLWPDERR